MIIYNEIISLFSGFIKLESRINFKNAISSVLGIIFLTLLRLSSDLIKILLRTELSQFVVPPTGQCNIKETDNLFIIG